jgi:hypothetical protein
VVEAVFYANRDDAFEAAGLSRREAGARVPKPASGVALRSASGPTDRRYD